MSKTTFTCFTFLKIFMGVVTRVLADDTSIAISCIKMVCQSGLPGAVVVLEKIMMVKNKCFAHRSWKFSCSYLWNCCSGQVKILYIWNKVRSAFSSYFWALSSLVFGCFVVFWWFFLCLFFWVFFGFFWWSFWRSVVNQEIFCGRPLSEVLFSTSLCCV